MVEELLARLVEKVEGRFYGKYRALVVDNGDPEKRGRLKLKIPSVLGNEVVSGWALPCAPYGGAADQGFYFIPEVDSAVWVEFESGLLDYPIWVGTFWSKPGGNSEVPKPNGVDGTEESDVQSPPTRKIIKTLKGHTIQLEDADDGDLVMLLEATNGNLIVMNSDGIKIVDGKNKTTITLDDNGLKIEAAKDIELKADGGVKITAGKDLELKATGDIKMDAVNVKVKVSAAMDVS
ncbi:MAG TPA: phage baseplate assembly protein V [Pyrinomonadaceae bacterium]|jgi:Uncharacterized protein conserved in bacteria